ncbi:MAG: (deoxy)nucleoside triphosphate pyrophosphohydrolase [Bdellovibrionota bacterium]
MPNSNNRAQNSNQASTQPANGKKTTRSKKNWIPVVAGIIKKNNMILVGQRPETHTLGGLWEFPGGKIEMGESPEYALARELREELGIEAEIGDLKIACTHSYGDVGILILFYEVLFWKGEPKAQHHTGLDWVVPSELPNRNIPEANRKNLPRIYKAFDL